MISTIKPFKSNPRPRGPSLLLFIESDTRQDLCFQCPLKPTKRIMSGCVLGFRGSHSLPITTPLMGAASLWFTCIACVCVCVRGWECCWKWCVFVFTPSTHPLPRSILSKTITIMKLQPVPHTKSSHNDSTGSYTHTLLQLTGADSLMSACKF